MVLETFLRYLWSYWHDGPKCAKENIPHILTLPPLVWTVETGQNGSMLTCCLLDSKFGATEVKIHQTRKHVRTSSVVPGWRSRVKLTGVAPAVVSAAVANLLQALTFCVFRNASLHTSVATNGYLSYHCLSISLKPSGHSPQTADISSLLPTGYFFFKNHYL